MRDMRAILRDQSGFTLIELLVVLLLLGLLSGAVVLTWPGSSEKTHDEIAQKIFARFHFARQDAVLNGQLIEAYLTDQNLVFSRFENGRWAKVEKPAALTIPENMRLDLGPENRVRFDPLGGVSRVEITLLSGGGEKRVKLGGL